MAQGRCSAMLLAVALVVVSAAVVVQGATYTVGDAQGWTVPPANAATYLVDWPKNKTFVAGDTLVFTYTAPAHNVLTVTAAAYSACTTSSPINTTATGKDSIILSAGTNYYICGISGHCTGGQKVSITAAAAAPGTAPAISPTGTPAPPAATPPAVPTPPGAAAGVNIPVFQAVAAAAFAMVGSLALC